jgi:hypothetical protein
LDLNATFLGPGHFSGIFGEWAVREYLEEMLDRTVAIEQRLVTCLKRMKRATVEQLAGEVFPIIDRFAWSPIQKHTVHCFLHKLRQEGKVQRVQVEAAIMWEEIL